MKKVINSIFDKIKNYQEKHRHQLVGEIADTIVETLTTKTLNGFPLKATELSSVVLEINASVLNFILAQKEETEEKLEDINNALSTIIK